MKTFTASCLACCALVLAGTSGVYAQGSNPLDPTTQKSKVLVGPVVGVNQNSHSGGFRILDGEPDCPVFTSGSGVGFLAGLSAEFQLGETWSIIPRVTYEARPGKFTQTLPDALVLLPGDDDPVTQTVTATSEITYTLLNIEAMYKQEFAQLGKVRFAVAAGPAAQLILGGTNLQVQDLDQPLNARFIDNDPDRPLSNNGRRRTMRDGDIPARESMRFSLKGGLQGEFGLFNNAWIMTPGVYYDYGLTDVTSAETWQLSTVMFQVDFRRAF